MKRWEMENILRTDAISNQWQVNRFHELTDKSEDEYIKLIRETNM